MRHISIVVLAVLTCLSLAQATPKDSYKIARRYIKDCKSNDNPPALGAIIGWDEVEKYWESSPELKELRIKYIKADKELMDILMLDDEYRAAKQKYNPDDLGCANDELLDQFQKVEIRVFARLQNKSHDYRRAKKKSDEALLESNIKTFEYILKDYETQNIEFPTDWIEKEI